MTLIDQLGDAETGDIVGIGTGKSLSAGDAAYKVGKTIDNKVVLIPVTIVDGKWVKTADKRFARDINTQITYFKIDGV